MLESETTRKHALCPWCKETQIHWGWVHSEAFLQPSSVAGCPYGAALPGAQGRWAAQLSWGGGHILGCVFSFLLLASSREGQGL